MHKTLADLMISSRLERLQLRKHHTKQPEKWHAPDVIGTNAEMSVIKTPWNQPKIDTSRSFARFTPGPDTIDFYVLGEHRYTPGHGHRMHVLGFVPDTDQVMQYPSGELAEVRFLPARELRGTLPSFERELSNVGLNGRLEDYILGQTAGPSLMRVDPTALSLSISSITIDQAIERAVEHNPGLSPYHGSKPKVFYGRPSKSKD